MRNEQNFEAHGSEWISYDSENRWKIITHQVRTQRTIGDSLRSTPWEQLILFEPQRKMLGLSTGVPSLVP
jgi:hypothetical protein